MTTLSKRFSLISLYPHFLTSDLVLSLSNSKWCTFTLSFSNTRLQSHTTSHSSHTNAHTHTLTHLILAIKFTKTKAFLLAILLLLTLSLFRLLPPSLSLSFTHTYSQSISNLRSPTIPFSHSLSLARVLGNGSDYRCLATIMIFVYGKLQ